MSRVRALFSILLAVTWCSAAWHVDLEALGMLLDHDHRAEHADAGHHAPLSAHDDHEQVVARDLAKDQVRVAPGAMLWFAVIGLVGLLLAALRPRVPTLGAWRRRRETDPPFARVWHFVQRCAPESAAPPALG